MDGWMDGRVKALASDLGSFAMYCTTALGFLFFIFFYIMKR